MVAGPEISRILEQLEDSCGGVRAVTRHHEETEANQKYFLEHVRQMTNAMVEQGNPFMEDTKDLIVLETKEIVGLKIGYNIYVLQQTACLVVNPITVGNFAFLFNCTPVGRTSDSMMVPT